MLKGFALVLLGSMIGAGSAPSQSISVSIRPPAFDAEDVLARSRAAYAALQSYADSGTVANEAAGFTDRSSFRVLFTRRPRYLLIDYRAIASEYTAGNRIPLDARIVLWMENGELQTWYSKTDDHETYAADGGQQVNALKSADYGTTGISILVPSHLYSQSGLASAVHATEEAEADGFEMIGGHRCYRLLGVERWRYPSGRETGVRPITLWIDAESFLLRKVLEDTPKGMPRGSISRRITMIQPHGNPKLEPAQFHFAVPEN